MVGQRSPRGRSKVNIGRSKVTSPPSRVAVVVVVVVAVAVVVVVVVVVVEVD